MKKYKPLDFLVIGAQKSATTWVTHNLNEHPDVVLPKYEIPCFEKMTSDRDELEGLVWLTKDVTPNQICGVKNTWLLYNPESPQLIKKYIPDIKLIASIRNPIDRVISAYYWHVYMGVMEFQDINLAINNEFSNQNSCLLNFGLYGEQLEKYLRIFSREQLLIVDFDDIAASENSAVQELFGFLKLQPTRSSKAQKSRPKKGIYSKNRLKLHALRNSVITRQDTNIPDRPLYKEQLNPAEMFVHYSLSFIDKFILEKLENKSLNRKPSLSECTRQKLIEYYRDDIKKLGGLLDKNYDHWLVG